jgi:hypothetical protein
MLPKNGDEQIVVLRDGHAIALVTPLDDDDLELFAQERDPDFVASIHRAREQAKRGETVSEEDLDRVLSDSLDGIDLSAFSPPKSVESLQRTNCRSAPKGAGVYIVLRPTRDTPRFLAKSVGGRFKRKDPSVSQEFLRKHWVDDATIIYIGMTREADGLCGRLGDLMKFGLGKPVGHWGGRLIWHLANYRQLLVRWYETDNPVAVEARLIREFQQVHGVRPFANLRG